MVVPTPPNPVTVTYIATCAGVAGAIVRGIYACLPKPWRKSRPVVSLLSLLIGGTYGFAIWVIALLGGFPEPARVLPTHFDALTLATSGAGIGGVFGAGIALYVRKIPKRDIDLDDWSARSMLIGALLGIILWLLLPGLHSCGRCSLPHRHLRTPSSVVLCGGSSRCSQGS
jgi:4-amino-4-deoxy-L-arabinose transferase-like glycosyltransferase